jgi:hypothetical protein
VKKTNRGVAVTLGAAAVLAGACSGSAHKAATPVTATSSTTVPATTTTVAPVYPLTGEPAPNPTAAANTAVVLKIDNVDAARPQTGVQSADIVYEAEVEGGLTRLAAVFQSDYPTNAGPVRSGRLTDEGVADDLNHPVLAFAGANSGFLPILQSQPITLITMESQPNDFVRVGNNIPHNLYTNVATLASQSTTHTAPPPMFQYLPSGQTFTGAAVSPASALSLNFEAASIGWTWDQATNSYLRTQNGTADVDSSGQQMHATNVVVYFVNYITSGMATGEGLPPVPIPTGIQTGTGAAWIFSAGKVVKGTWNRSSLTSVATYTDAAGKVIDLTPGNTWVELAPTGASVPVTP